MIYNFNLGIGWASSGVEYAQIYRAKIFRALGEPARFVFTDFFAFDNLADLTRNIGFVDEEVIWLYTFFTDFKVGPVTFTVADLLKQFSHDKYSYERENDIAKIQLAGQDSYARVFFINKDSDCVKQVEIVTGGKLVRKDYYMDKRYCSEYFAPVDGKAKAYARQFFNRDGSLAYEESIDCDDSMYRFPDRILTSKFDFVAYMVEKMNLTSDDIIIMDRTTLIAQPIFQNAGDAKIGIIVHAEHFSENFTDDKYILWNNYYEYPFSMHQHVDFYVCSTEEQSQILREQFRTYYRTEKEPAIFTVPVGGLEKLRYPQDNRKPYSVISVSRLAAEKHVDLVAQAVVNVKETFPDISFDIYGKGPTEKDIQKVIDDNHAHDYIHLMGQHKMDDLYQNYEVYVAGSMSEGFGLSLMETVGGGTGLIGFDVHYGNPTFIRDGQNGFLLPVDDADSDVDRVLKLTDGILRYFRELSSQDVHKTSYEIAQDYVNERVAQLWKQALQQIR